MREVDATTLYHTAEDVRQPSECKPLLAPKLTLEIISDIHQKYINVDQKMTNFRDKIDELFPEFQNTTVVCIFQ